MVYRLVFETSLRKSPTNLALRQRNCGRNIQHDKKHIFANLNYKTRLRVKIESLIRNPLDVDIVSNIYNLDIMNPTIGKIEKLLHIQQSVFTNTLNYVIDTILICNLITRAQSLVQTVVFI